MPETYQRPEGPISIIENRKIIMDENCPEPETVVPASNFEARKDGLFETDHAGHETRICDPIWHLGIGVRADDKNGACDIVEFLDRSGQRKSAIIPLVDTVNHPRKVFDVLADHNFAVPELESGPGQRRRKKILAYLAERRAAPARWFVLADRMGWHDASFVIGNDVISTDPSKGLKLTGPISQYAKKFTYCNDLAAYQHKVLRRASYSSRLMTGIALALLAPLARILSLENGGLNFIGKAGLGKTTILRVAGSFYGGGSVPYYMQWLMTDNAPETLGRGFCDLPLLLDELDALEPDPSRARGRLKTIVHRLAICQGKTLSHRSLGGASAQTDFHVLYGSTSEHRLPDFMRDGGSKMTGGQAARFVDIPADAARGLKIFESLPRNAKSGDIPDVDRYLQRLNQACESYYGVAGRAYLKRLVRERASDPSALEAFLRQEMARFEADVANHAQVDPRIRRRFAGLFAAGQLGLRYQILPSRCDRFMEAISTCYWAAIANETTASLSSTEAAACLSKFLRGNRDRLLKVNGKAAFTKDSYREAVGLFPDPDRHGNRVWLKSRVLQTSVFQPGAMQSAVTQLGKSGIIVPSRKGLVAQQQRVRGLNVKDYFYVIDVEKLRALK
jgi:putative DNA primase/helicase